MATRYLPLAVVACLIWPCALGQVAQVTSKAVRKANNTSSDTLDARLRDSVNSQTQQTQLPVYRANLNPPGQINEPADAVVLFTIKSLQLITYRVLVGSAWTAGWDPGNVLALFTNPDVTGNSSMVAILCGPMATHCSGGHPNTDLVVGNLTISSILGTSIIDFNTLFVLLGGYLIPWSQDNSTSRTGLSSFYSSSPDQETRVPGVLVSALGPVAPGTHSSATLLTGNVTPTNAAALPIDQVPFADGLRGDEAAPYHAFLWPVPPSQSSAAGSIGLTLYNDSSLAYTIMLSGMDANDSITSVAMESLNPALLKSADGFPAAAFAYSGNDCCGGTAPNFFSSYPTGVQAPLDASSFMLASAEWPPPDQSTKQGRYLAGMLADLQNDNFLVGVRVRTKQAPDGLLMGEIVMGCGPDGLNLPITDGCSDMLSGNRRRRH